LNQFSVTSIFGGYLLIPVFHRRATLMHYPADHPVPGRRRCLVDDITVGWRPQPRYIPPGVESEPVDHIPDFGDRFKAPRRRMTTSRAGIAAPRETIYEPQTPAASAAPTPEPALQFGSFLPGGMAGRGVPQGTTGEKPNGLIAALAGGGPAGVAVATKAAPAMAKGAATMLKHAIEIGGGVRVEQLIEQALPEEVRPVRNWLKSPVMH
jgi:hypothetical protein